MRSIFIFLFILLNSSLLFSQEAKKTFVLEGVVTAFDGILVPDTKVTATNVSGKDSSARTGRDGKYKLVLAPGVYRVLFEHDGFKRMVFPKVVVPIANAGRLDVGMELGQCSDCDTDTQVFLTGTVKDQNGAVVPDAIIKAINKKGKSFETVSDANGTFLLTVEFYSYDARGVGSTPTYKITADRPKSGFKKTVIENFQAEPQRLLRLDLVLEAAPPTDHDMLYESPVTLESRSHSVSTDVRPRPMEPVLFKYQVDSRQIVSGMILMEKTVGKGLETIEGAVITFTAEAGEYFTATATADAEGMYEISLPEGKYSVYATANKDCWMCAEYYNKGFVVDRKRKVKLDAVLVFMGEGRAEVPTNE
jgi:Carboxypeptidase regulatory-like domain